VVSAISAFRTFDWDMPNCRAIRDGVIPALYAAWTALICPRVNEPVGNSTGPLRHDARFGSSGGFGSTFGRNLPPLRLINRRDNQQVKFRISEVPYRIR